MPNSEGSALQPGGDADITALQAEVLRSRAELRQTAALLTAKVDVKARVADKAAGTRQRFSEAARAVKDQVAATFDVSGDNVVARAYAAAGHRKAVVVAIALAAAAVIWSRRS